MTEKNIVERLKNDVCLTSSLDWQEHVALAREAAITIKGLAGALREAVTWDGHDADGFPAVWLEDAEDILSRLNLESED